MLPNELENPLTRTKCLLDVLAVVERFRKGDHRELRSVAAEDVRVLQEGSPNEVRPRLVRLAASAIYALETLENSRR